jgi:hypothetical protein
MSCSPEKKKKHPAGSCRKKLHTSECTQGKAPSEVFVWFDLFGAASGLKSFTIPKMPKKPAKSPKRASQK